MGLISEFAVLGAKDAAKTAAKKAAAKAAEKAAEKEGVSFAAKKAAKRVSMAVDRPASKSSLAVMPSAQPRLPVDATLGIGAENEVPVTFRGMEPKDWGPQDFHDFGVQYGVPNLGPSNAADWEKGLQTHTLSSGRQVTLPDLSKPLTYYDLQHIQAQGLNPHEMAPELRQPLHDAMINAMQPVGDVSNERLANGYLMGLLSPNNQLTPNQFAVQRAMIKGPKDLQTMAAMAPWNYKGEGLDQEARRPIGDEIARRMGTDAAPSGLGVRGSQEQTVLPMFAQRMLDTPEFYRFDPKNFPENYTPAEQWASHVERVYNATPGLKAKTGSFGAVWQSPKDAAISAVDRHIAGALHGSMFPDEAARAAWENRVINKFNADKAGKKNFTPVSSIEELRKTPGGLGAYTDAAMSYVNATPTANFRNAKTGELNPRLSETLKSAQWPGGVEPKTAELLSPAYSRVLDENARMAADKGQGLFSNQWFNWDPLRKRVEPHGIMFPGLEKLPRMSLQQMKDVAKVYSDAGYLSKGAVRPLTSAAKAAFFGVPLAIAAPQLLKYLDGNQGDEQY